MLNGVIFDLDGVVIDSHPIHRRAWLRFLDSLGISIADGQLEFVTQGGKREDILRHFLGPLTDEQVKDYGRRKEALFREEALEIQPIAGLGELLAALEEAGVQIGLASCGSQMRVHYVLDRLGWTHRFKCILTGDDVAHGKPDPTIFLKAAEKLQVACKDSVVVEDAVPGVQAAVAAGMKAIGVASNGATRDLLAAGAARVISNFMCFSVADMTKLFDSETNVGCAPATLRHQ